MKRQEEIELLKSRWPNLKWEPEHAAFQLTENHFYGRHGKHYGDLDWHQIHYEVKKAWNLSPFAQDDTYIYYKP